MNQGRSPRTDCGASLRWKICQCLNRQCGLGGVVLSMNKLDLLEGTPDQWIPLPPIKWILAAKEGR
jgi:hypothetical protein